MEHAPAGETFTTYNFEVADFHTYFVGEDGVWVHNSGNGHCEKIFSLYQRFRERAPANESAYETLLRIKQRANSTTKFPGVVWRQSAKSVSEEMFADAAAGKLPLNKIPSYTDWSDNFRPGLGSAPSLPDDVHIHHAVETWMQKSLGIVGDPNDVPGCLIFGKDHTPAVGSLANRLSNEIRRAGLTNPLEITTKMRDIYVDAGYNDLWVVTKMWLTHKGVPTP